MCYSILEITLKTGVKSISTSNHSNYFARQQPPSHKGFVLHKHHQSSISQLLPSLPLACEVKNDYFFFKKPSSSLQKPGLKKTNPSDFIDSQWLTQETSKRDYLSSKQGKTK
jgi:hypothetical protein